jgi:hypothetical protein
MCRNNIPAPSELSFFATHRAIQRLVAHAASAMTQAGVSVPTANTDMGVQLPAPGRPSRRTENRRAEDQAEKTYTHEAIGRAPMKNTGTLKLTTPIDREIAMTRTLDAPRRLVFATLRIFTCSSQVICA